MKIVISFHYLNKFRFMTRSSFDTYFACTWTASLVALLFGIFKCRSMADVLFGLSETDAQVKEKYIEYYRTNVQPS